MISFVISWQDEEMDLSKLKEMQGSFLHQKDNSTGATRRQSTLLPTKQMYFDFANFSSYLTSTWFHVCKSKVHKHCGKGTTAMLKRGGL